MAFDYSLRFTGQDDLSGVLGKVKKEIKDMGKEASNVELVDKAMGKIITSSGKLNTKVKQTSALLAEMKFDGDYNSEQFLKVAKAAGNAKDAISDTQAMVKFFADDRRWLNTTVQGFQALAGIGSIAAGGMSLLGIESENATKAIQGCQQALAILNGITTVANLLDKEGYLMTAKKILGLKAEAAAIDKATEAQTRNNIAVKANLYVMLAMVVAAAAVAVYNFAKSNDEATRAQEDLNKASENYKKNQESQNQTVAESIIKFKTLQSQWNDLGNDLNAKKKFVDDNKTAFKDLGLKVDGVTSAESVFGKNANAIIAAMKARAKATAAYATMVDNLKDQYVKLGEIERKIKNGEQFSQSDLADIGILNPDAMAGLREDFTFSALFGGQKYYTVIGKSAADQIMDSATLTLENRADELNKPFELAAKRAQEEAASVPFYSPGSSSSGSGRSGSGRSGKGSSNSPTKVIAEEHGILLDLNKELEKKNKELDQENLTLAQQYQLLKEIAELQNRINRIQRARKAATDGTLANALKPQPLKLTPKIDEKKLDESIAKLMARIKAATGGTHFEKMQKQIEDNRAKMDAWGDTATAIGQNFSVLGDIFSAVGDSAAAGMMQIAASTAQAVAQIIPQIMALIGAKEGEALASGTASAAGLPFPANIAAIATIVASVLSVFATIASVAGSFANGGIISGGSSYGDQILARVNAGEMVLNRKQQSNLFRAIESGNIGAGQTVLVPEFKIKGSDLYGTLRNFSKSVGKTGKVTGIR